jgi:hypothetical protein
MRRARRTYEGAFHHVTNRGINGEDIFTGNQNKSQFLDFLSEKSRDWGLGTVRISVEVL